jgi:Xaa-Pro aminopeptidase
MREDRLDAYLAENDLESVWFARPNSFAWLTGGDNVVDRAGDVGVAAAGYDGDGVTVVTDNIEGQRLADEELDDGVAVVETDWHAESLADGVTEHAPEPAAADFDVPRFESVDASPLRHPLTDDDVERYRRLGQKAAAAVEAVCKEVEPGDTEHEVASALRVALSARDVEAPVILVGGAERAQRYRHYTPKKEELGDYALVSVTAESGGLHASLTRMVAFDPPARLADRHEAAMRVETTALAATRTAAANGDDAGAVFEEIQNAYAAVGHEGEWERHHQGGAAGFAGREWIATPGHDGPVTTPMGYAWNPTVRGAKSEDTVLVTDDGFEVLTRTGRWPTETVDAVGYDAQIDRHLPLDRSSDD